MTPSRRKHVHTDASRVGSTSFDTWLEMRPSYDPGTLYAEGAAKVVWCDLVEGKSNALPEKIRQIVEG